jgi:hypothetical protein
MKKYIYLLGILTANLIMSGSLFKVMHWPGANILLVSGTILFGFLFLPVALIASYMESGKYKILHWVTYLVFTSGVFTVLFKAMHWPGSDILLKCSLPLPFVLFLPVYLYQTRHTKEVTDNDFLGVLFGLTFIAVFSALLTLH